MNDIKRGPLANTIALHHFDSNDVDYKGWFEYAEQWFLRHNLKPNKISGKGNKNITFSRGKKALEKENFHHIKKEGVWIGALPPEDKISTEAFDFIFSVYIDAYDESQKNTCIFCWDDQLLPWDSVYIANLVKDLLQFLKPKYGYVFQRSFKKGPLFYPAGVIAGLDYGDLESKEMSSWGFLKRGKHPLYRPHMIRDIYPINFLTPQHLTADVGGETFQQWIEKKPAHGKLEEIAPEFWSWEVHKKDIESIRAFLKPKGFVISHIQDYIEDIAFKMIKDNVPLLDVIEKTALGAPMISKKMMKENIDMASIIKFTELPKEDIIELAEVYGHKNWLDKQLIE